MASFKDELLFIKLLL